MSIVRNLLMLLGIIILVVAAYFILPMFGADSVSMALARPAWQGDDGTRFSGLSSGVQCRFGFSVIGGDLEVICSDPNSPTTLDGSSMPGARILPYGRTVERAGHTLNSFLGESVRLRDGEAIRLQDSAGTRARCMANAGGVYCRSEIDRSVQFYVGRGTVLFGPDARQAASGEPESDSTNMRPIKGR